jgi:hypothetical protein
MSEKDPKPTAPPGNGKKTHKGQLSERELAEVTGGLNPQPLPPGVKPPPTPGNN